MPSEYDLVIEISSDLDNGVADGSPTKTTHEPSFMVSSSSKLGKDAMPSIGSRTGEVKYSNANTVSQKQRYFILAWKQAWNRKGCRLDYKPIDGRQAFEPDSERAENPSTHGFLVSNKGIELAEHLAKETKKREYVDDHDSSGCGVSEVMLNMLSDFNQDLFRPTFSPYRKWAHVEGLASYLKVENLMNWAMCNDSLRIRDIVDEFGLMILTSLEMLSEHNLLAPDSRVKNIPIILLLMLNFAKEWEPLGYHIRWPCEVVRLCDEAGIDLAQCIQHTNGMITVKEERIQAWRKDYEKKRTSSDFAKLEPFNGNGYMYWARKKNWQPKHDGQKFKEFYQPDDPRNYGREEKERDWFRWDWKIEYPAFTKEYPGGTSCVLYNNAVSGRARGGTKKKATRAKRRVLGVAVARKRRQVSRNSRS
ncbi:hypothetical protein DSL72_005932 [Monilinia vaccinii-corymbosi]|uniref:Uncharacterized protein n=1 Tax=Monilinia vaccinii-corymbosi TaxID=61207 RepID=A0A8A3PH68_9HELO|nr:hypothetical protein DSL72_005932 [Monilinia vaccinii-corymbosi]